MVEFLSLDFISAVGVTEHAAKGAQRQAQKEGGITNLLEICHSLFPSVEMSG